MQRDIQIIQNTFWVLYQNLLRDHDKVSYKKRVEELQRNYESHPVFGCFCKNLYSCWQTILSYEVREINMQAIQTELWCAYKACLVGGRAGVFTKRAAALVKRYEQDKALCSFCQNLIISWAPVITAVLQEQRGVAYNG